MARLLDNVPHSGDTTGPIIDGTYASQDAHPIFVIFSGATPITVNGRPLSLIVLPTTAGSPPKRRCQHPYPITATGFAAGVRSSSALNKRPRAGSTPSIEK